MNIALDLCELSGTARLAVEICQVYTRTDRRIPKGVGMERRALAVLVLGVGALVAGVPAWAHHSFAAAYDTTNAITVHGVISQVLLRNPHSWFVIDVKDASGKIEQWSFEAGTPSGMIRNGYKPNIIKQGAEVTIKGFRARDASQNRGMLRELTTADGQVYGMFGPQEGPGK